MGWGKLAILSVCLLAGCVGKNSPSQACDPQTEDCSVGPGGTGRCVRDSDCGDGICQPDGTCRAVQPVTQPTACANVSCPAGNFCSNGQCIPATAQCKRADPACIFIPHGSFEPPARAWWWPFTTPLGPDEATHTLNVRADLEYPDFVQVMSTPVVIRLHPKDAEPAVVFNSFSLGGAGALVETQGVLRAVRGSDGSPIWTAPDHMWSHMEQSVNGNSGIAAGDCMGTGEVCFITGGWNPYDIPCDPKRPKVDCDPTLKPGHAHERGGLIAFGSDGRFLWVNPGASLWWGAPAIARLLGPQGPAQVATERLAGHRELAGLRRLVGAHARRSAPAGRGGEPRFLRIHDWTGGLLLNRIPLPQHATGPGCDAPYNPGGPPTIADFDGDGLPEIGVASQSAYSVWKPGQGWIWSSETYDCSANTGSSVFDFEGKGQATVVYSDQCFFHVFDGKSGQALISEANSSCTAYEMPIVADIDGTGRAKVLVPNNNVCKYPCAWGRQDQHFNVGLKALKSPNDKWVNTRSVWNEHTYHVSNVNLDGTLPFPETNSWAPGQSNSYRQNVQGQGMFSSPDLSICAVDADMTTCRAGAALVSAVVYNGGALVSQPGVTVDFYVVLENGQTAHLGQTATTRSLKPGDSETVSVPWNTPPQTQAGQVTAGGDEQGVGGDSRPGA